jgi:hypothetical protein
LWVCAGATTERFLQFGKAIPPTPTTEVNAGHDGDGDDGTSKAAAAPGPAPTVNSSGQTIGQTINIKA